MYVPCPFCKNRIQYVDESDLNHHIIYLDSKAIVHNIGLYYINDNQKDTWAFAFSYSEYERHDTGWSFWKTFGKHEFRIDIYFDVNGIEKLVLNGSLIPIEGLIPLIDNSFNECGSLENFIQQIKLFS